MLSESVSEMAPAGKTAVHAYYQLCEDKMELRAKGWTSMSARRLRAKRMRRQSAERSDAAA